jgi:lipoprotein-anchoring transpeptidase ErfK/SrfK
MGNRIIKTHTIILAIILAIFTVGCEPGPMIDQAKGGQQNAAQEPTLDVSPIEQEKGPWKIAASEKLTLTVTAPGAKSARILYRPVAASDRLAVLKTMGAPTDQQAGKFTHEIKLVQDFAGDVWAEVTYPDGAKKETKTLAVAANMQESATASPDGSVINDESERSDKFTGGKIEKAEFQAGQPDIRLTLNVPSFKLTFWQNGKEVKSYPVGVGRKDFPIVIGERKTTQVIWNPDWVPPDSEWVEDYKYKVEPGERIEADDPRNPLGKVKIPLGDGFLLHQAGSRADLGNLVSHGCIRVLKEDLFDLAEKIVAARNWPVSKEQIERAKTNKERLVAKLDQPLVVDINYDTQVVEGGVLHVYPDVYARGTNTVENLRAELQSVGVDPAKLDDAQLKQMLDRATKKEEFVVSVAEIKSGNSMIAGKNEPLVPGSNQKQPVRTSTRRSAAGRR